LVGLIIFFSQIDSMWLDQDKTKSGDF